MPLNTDKVASIILDQGEEIEERREGYRKKILHIVCDIIEYEWQHRVQATNIQQKINEKCKEAGSFLIEKEEKEK